jgi:hypothetical protein
MLYHFFADPKLFPLFGAIYVGLIIAFINSLWSFLRDRNQEYKTAYLKFAGIFTEYLQALENRKLTLNCLIVDEFPKHDLARRDFVRYLRGSRKRKFAEQWMQYKEKYDQVKNLGMMYMAIAIAPSGVDLKKVRPSPQQITQWEVDRRKEIYKIIDELLKIAKAAT